MGCSHPDQEASPVPQLPRELDRFASLRNGYALRTAPNIWPAAPSPAIAPERASGNQIENLSSHAPASAPASISATDEARLVHPGFAPPAIQESAAIPAR